ncbi:MAG: YqcC family protein [Planctomycetota bacterium]
MNGGGWIGIRSRLDAIVGAMQTAGFWQEDALPPEAFGFERAFAADTMSFPQWLQFVFVPRVESILAGVGELPSSSSLAAYAARDLDGVVEAEELIRRLQDFDDLVNSAGTAAAPPGVQSDAEGDFSQDPVASVRAYMLGLQTGSRDLVFSRVTRATASAPHYDPTPPFPIESFDCASPEPDGDRVTVPTTIRGRDETGAPIETPMPFVLLHEDGEWKIDMDLTVARLMGFDPAEGAGAADRMMDEVGRTLGGVMQNAVEGMAGAFSLAFGSEVDSERQERREDLERRRSDVWEVALRNTVNPALTLDIEVADAELDLLDLDHLHALLMDEFPTATYMADTERWSVLAPRIERLSLRVVSHRIERRFELEENTLVIHIGPTVFDGTFERDEMARRLEFEAFDDHVERWHEMQALALELEYALANEFGLDVLVILPWNQLAEGPNTLRTSWNLHLMSTVALPPLAEALPALLRRRPDLVEPARLHLAALEFDVVGQPWYQAVDHLGSTLVYHVHLEETYAENWSASDLEPLLETALSALLSEAAESDVPEDS